MATLTQVRFTLAAPDLARATAWYTSALGMAVDFTAPGWSFLSRGAFRVMLGECPDALPADALGDHSWYGYVTVDDAASPFDEYRAAGRSPSCWRTSLGACVNSASARPMVTA